MTSHCCDCLLQFRWRPTSLLYVWFLPPSLFLLRPIVSQLAGAELNTIVRLVKDLLDPHYSYFQHTKVWHDIVVLLCFVASPPILQQTTSPIVSTTQCKQHFGQSKITNSMICAGASGSSSCKVLYVKNDKQLFGSYIFVDSAVNDWCLCVDRRVILVVLWYVRVQVFGIRLALCPGVMKTVMLVLQWSTPASLTSGNGSTRLSRLLRFISLQWKQERCVNTIVRSVWFFCLWPTFRFYFLILYMCA